MKAVLRIFRNVPVLVAVCLLAVSTPLPAPAQPSAGASPAVSAPVAEFPPEVTPRQIELWREILQSGQELPPEAARILEARPDLKKALELRPDWKARLSPEAPKGMEGTEAETAKVPAGTASRGAEAAAPRYDWRRSVYIGGLFLKRLRNSEVETLSHFGHEIFEPRPGGAIAPESMPVSPGYIVGPGDEVIVRLWGRMEGTHRVTVDRDGKIFLPKIGSLYVAGKTFAELTSFIRSKVSTTAEVSSDVSLGRMKGIRVSVLGEVRAPGWYNVSSLNTALQAISLAGGIKDIGSLRRIELRRGGRAVQSIDLYDFLLAGETGSDVRMLPGDAVFVPVVGTLAAVVGEVRRPAIYELGAERTLLDVVKMAGGFAPSAYKMRVQVERFEGHKATIVLDIDADELEKGRGGFEVSDGDIVRVLPILLTDVNAVTLEGNVLRPGKYELTPRMTVGNLFRDENDFLPDTYFDYALLTRTIPPEFRQEVLSVNLREIVLEKKKEADVPLRARDTLTVFPRDAFRPTPKATISGEVRWPDTYDLKKGARVSDLVKQAGDLTKDASLPRAVVVRTDEKRNFRILYFDLGRAMAGDDKEDPLLEDEDRVFIRSIVEGRYKKTVTVEGEVNQAGDYDLAEGMKLSDLVFLAGGFKESAYRREAELVRREIAPGGELVKTETVVVYPERAAEGDAGSDVLLKEYDLLIVRQIPDWEEKIQVTLSGEVRFPGVYAAKKGERLSSVIRRAGGFTPSAYLKAAQFTRVSTRTSQQEAIERLIEELELEVAQKAQTSTVLDREDVEANKELLNARKGLIAQLRKARAKGRVVVHLASVEELKGSSADVLLEDGDRLEVPKKMNVVNVVGRVYNPTGVIYDPANDRLGYYLNTVGGPTESADREHIFMIKANGSVVTRENVNSGFSFLKGGLLSAKVEPGDSIVVPEKLVQTRVMKDVKDITQILYQIAVTAGVLIVAF